MVAHHSNKVYKAGAAVFRYCIMSSVDVRSITIIIGVPRERCRSRGRAVHACTIEARTNVKCRTRRERKGSGGSEVPHGHLS